jgi:S-adenosylmethionine synthetase
MKKGISTNINVNIKMHKTSAEPYDDEKLLEIVKKNFNFEVGNIISELDLRKPIYHRTSCYGHFGDPKFTWEKVKKLEY